MNINEVKQPSDKKLSEDLEKDNTTGYSAADLMEIYRTHHNARWKAESFDSLMEAMDQMDAEYDASRSAE